MDGWKQKIQDQMVAGASKPRRRWIVPSLLGIAGLLLVVLILGSVDRDSRALTTHSPKTSLEKAKTADLLQTAQVEASKSSEERDWDFVQQASQIVLRRDPLNASALALYGFSLDAHGEDAQALDVIRAANARDPRILAVNIWLFNHYAAANEFSEAIRYADMTLRFAGRVSGQLYASFGQFVTVPSGLTAVTNALAKNPPWRSGFLRYLSRNKETLPTAYIVLSSLQGTRAPPTNDELAPVLNAMIENGAYQDALFLWIGTLPNEQSAGLDYLPNGHFQFPISGLPFDWTLVPQRGMEISIASPEGADHALRIDLYRGRLGANDLARKLLVLAPGRYSFSFREKSNRLGLPRGLTWQISCVQDNAKVLTASPPLKGTLSWTREEIAFNVPETDCPAQWLRLRIEARAALDREATGGSAWFTDFKIDREADIISN
ncbi:tetratricopeptide repeat protein [Amorphus sp. 3PC139-8]|uniref:tetratricopeptide repeat protein n=1 Tax=Amorphus sp. 3PC139-8 TaxID=2735676 RepID=UPI00345D3E48